MLVIFTCNIFCSFCSSSCSTSCSHFLWCHRPGGWWREEKWQHLWKTMGFSWKEQLDSRFTSSCLTTFSSSPERRGETHTHTPFNTCSDLLKLSQWAVWFLILDELMFLWFNLPMKFNLITCTWIYVYWCTHMYLGVLHACWCMHVYLDVPYSMHILIPPNRTESSLKSRVNKDRNQSSTGLWASGRVLLFYCRDPPWTRLWST